MRVTSAAYPVSAILRAGGLDPEAVCVACGVDPAGLVPVRPAPRWMRRMWVGPVAAMTLPWAIYVDPATLAGGGRRLARLLTHELVHLGQWRTMGMARFTTRYLTEYLKGRLAGLPHWEAYEAISLEREARAGARSLAD